MYLPSLAISCLVMLTCQLAPCWSQTTGLEAVVETQGNAIAALQAVVGQLAERQCGCEKLDTMAFTVYMDYPSVSSVTNATIPFTKERTNLGGSFSLSTGTYTVPMDGTYVFYARVDCTPDYRAFQIRVNGVMKALAHNDADDHSLATYAILVLKDGDKVNLVHDRMGGRIDGGEESIFAGFRLGD